MSELLACLAALAGLYLARVVVGDWLRDRAATRRLAARQTAPLPYRSWWLP